MHPVSRSNDETVSSDSDDNSFPSETAYTSLGSDASSDSTEEQETESDASNGFDFEKNRLQLRLSRANESIRELHLAIRDAIAVISLSVVAYDTLNQMEETLSSWNYRLYGWGYQWPEQFSVSNPADSSRH